MNNLFNQADVAAIIERIEKLQPSTARNWGKMNAAQMLAHCNKSLETAMGRNQIKRLLIGRILAPFVRPAVLGTKPFGKNSPTDRTYIFRGNHDFGFEKTRTIETIKNFHLGGPAGCTTYPHPFFGKFSPEQWAVFQWKHLDHHLRQFGV